METQGQPYAMTMRAPARRNDRVVTCAVIGFGGEAWVPTSS